MEGRSSVSKAVLTSGELTEVLRGLGNDIVVEVEDNATGSLAVDGDIELDSDQHEVRARSTNRAKGRTDHANPP